ncbi:hypothetical protein CFD26_100088, partial [Aspergillus turcosus]
MSALVTLIGVQVFSLLESIPLSEGVDLLHSLLCFFSQPSDTMHLPDRRGEMAEAEAKWPLRLTKQERSCTKLLDEFRPLEWCFGRDGKPAVKSITTHGQQSAAVLFERGIRPTKPCKGCSTGTFQFCVVTSCYGPKDEPRAFFA